MVGHLNDNLSINEGFVMFDFQISTCFIDGFTSKIKSQSIFVLLNGSERIYWDLENELHLVWVIWTSDLQECKDKLVF